MRKRCHCVLGSFVLASLLLLMLSEDLGAMAFCRRKSYDLGEAARQQAAATQTHWDTTLTPNLRAALENPKAKTLKVALLIVFSDLPGKTAEDLKTEQLAIWQSKLEWDPEPAPRVIKEEVLKVVRDRVRSVYFKVVLEGKPNQKLRNILHNTIILWAGRASEAAQITSKLQATLEQRRKRNTL